MRLRPNVSAQDRNTTSAAICSAKSALVGSADAPAAAIMDAMSGARATGEPGPLVAHASGDADAAACQLRTRKRVHAACGSEPDVEDARRRRGLPAEGHWREASLMDGVARHNTTDMWRCQQKPTINLSTPCQPHQLASPAPFMHACNRHTPAHEREGACPRDAGVGALHVVCQRLFHQAALEAGAKKRTCRTPRDDAADDLLCKHALRSVVHIRKLPSHLLRRGGGRWVEEGRARGSQGKMRACV
eukprot:363144-Chlamydomonas_euryale.AAC.2